MAKIPTQLENTKGLHQRYKITKLVKDKMYPDLVTETEAIFERPVDQDAEYFVMRLDTGGSDIEHIKACRIGVHAYADAIEHHLPELAKDIRERYPLL